MSPPELTIQDAISRGLLFTFWWTLLALAVYMIIGQVIKPGLHLWATRKPAPVPKDSDEAKRLKVALLRKTALYRYIVRVLAVVAGGLGGLLPFWPAWIPLWGGIMAGLSAGGFSTQVHAIIKRRLPGWADKLGGAAVHVIENAPGDQTETGSFGAADLPEPEGDQP